MNVSLSSLVGALRYGNLVFTCPNVAEMQVLLSHAYDDHTCTKLKSPGKAEFLHFNMIIVSSATNTSQSITKEKYK
jgi:hypothetical protein